MRTGKSLLLLLVLMGIAAFTGHPKAAGPTATFHVIGDLPGGGALTTVTNATRVGSSIYAVGGLVTRFCSSPCALPTGTDTNFLWRYDGTSATLDAMPDIDPVVGTLTNPALNIPSGITPDGRYIASTARIAVASTPPYEGRAVRVDTAALGSPAANLNLNTVSSPNLVGPTGGFFISSDGTIIYGVGFGRGIRFDTTGATNLFIPLLCPAVSAQCSVADTTNNVRGASANANVAVGASFSNVNNHKAFRYVLGSGVTAIPFLPGGTFNDPLALSPDGDLVLVVGNGTGAPNSEPYLYRASTGQIQRLGSPNPNLLEAWGPGGRICANSTGTCNPRAIAGGVSADGSVVAMNFGSPFITGGQYAYFHNQYGWFHLTSALLAHGVDLGVSGWDPQTLFIRGVSSDGRLVFGSGAQNGVVKGFVADFPAGALASFNPPPSPPADPSIVGAWTVPDEPDQTVVFTADGAYFHIVRMESGSFVMTGFEHGYYTYNGSVFTVTTLFDSNGKEGFSDGNGSTFPIAVTGNTLTFLDDPEDSHLERLVGGPGSIVGGWVQGSPAQRNSSFVVVFSDNGHILQATDNPEFSGPEAGHGTYTFGPAITCAPFTHELNIFPDDGGSPDLHNCGTLSSNELEIHALDDDGHSEFHLARVIDPRTPLITSALNAAATTGLAFQYQITGTNNPSAFNAVGLPTGLNINTNTGLISGTPAVVGTFDVRIEASNALSTSTGRNHLSLVIVAPAAVSEGSTTVTPIPPDEPGEAPPVTIEFENVTNGGTISVATIDPETVLSAPDPPAGFALGDNPVYYEITTGDGLTFDGPVTVCFSYAGITFSGFPRLLHYDEGLATWVDITTSVDEAMQIICGETTSFSPFLMAASALAANGFHAPISPLAGSMNTAKGGSTVALKFNVFSGAGVEVTDPAQISNLVFETAPVSCDGGAAVNWGAATTTGRAGLRYDTASHQFVQNWKTPAVPGCYFVRVKADGLLLSALFNIR